jgi:hypothetical protein
VNGALKTIVPVAALLAVAACSSNGGSSTMPGMSGQTNTQQSMPDWQKYHTARRACPTARLGEAQCEVLIQSGTVRPEVAGWAPLDIQTAYKLPITQGKGQVVAIVDAYDNPNVTTDLAAYRTNFGLGTAKFNKYNQNGMKGSYPSGNTGWGVEIDLDVQMVSAACPLCTIDLIEANGADTSDLQTAELEAVKLGAHIVSNSWICYGSDACVTASDFNHAGVTYMAASGDSGYGQNGAPMALTSVISVGGTNLIKSGSTYSETVWSGSGSGCSNDITKPAWQHDPGCTGSTRNDTAAVASNVAEYDTYGQGGWFTVGGTSVASPIISGVFALAGNATKRQSGKHFWMAKAAAQKSQFHYKIPGSNGSCGGSYLCTGDTGQYKTYSGPTGWGTPNGIKGY